MTDSRSCGERRSIHRRGKERGKRREEREERSRVKREKRGEVSVKREREREIETDRELTVQVLSLIFISTVISNMWCLN